MHVYQDMKNIIFDFGNVLVQWTPEQVYNNFFGDEARTWWFMRHVATPEWRLRIDAGESQENCIRELCSQWPQYADAIEIYHSRWREMLPGEVPGMRQLLQELLERDDVQVYGLTNWSMETFPEARQRLDILQLIDRYVVSGAEGLVKPDARLFQVLLDRYQLTAGDCIFIDDNEANVQTACALGMEGIVFQGAEDLRRRLGLPHPLSEAERKLLEVQGCSSSDWSLVTLCGNLEDCRIRHVDFEGPVEIGLNAQISHCCLNDCRIGDDCELSHIDLLSRYDLGRGCHLQSIHIMTFSPEGAHADVMNENGGRRIGLQPGMTVGDAYIWARYRDRSRLMQQIARFDDKHRGYVGERCQITGATAIIDSIAGPGCNIGPGVIVERSLLGENVKLEAGLRLNDSVVGDNSTLARGEVGCSLIFPAHEQHHNSSFLIASLLQGQSNVASGATLGSNHNGRTADGELSAGRGFWPGLCVSVKHNCRFASYTLLAKGDYPSEMNITLPFSLVNNNQRLDRLEVMPAYWWLYNMYALDRNRTKFAARDKRHFRSQHIEFNPFAPDTAEEMLIGRSLLHMWTAKAYQENGGSEVVAYGMERGHRKTVILKPGEAYKAYEEMLIYYAMSSNPQACNGSSRVQRWVNVGGQLVQGKDMDTLLEDIELGRINSWNGVNRRLDDLWARYTEDRSHHAYGVLCELAQKKELDQADWNYFSQRYATICQLVRDRIVASRQKDADNEFRQTTFWNTAEMQAVIK